MADQMFSPSIVDKVPGYTLGCTSFDDDGNAWTYIGASEALTAHYCAMYRQDFTGRLVTTIRCNAWDKAHNVGWPLVTIPSGSYGWVQVFGLGLIRVSAGIAHGAFPYTTATEGELDDAASGNQRVRRVMTTETGPSSDGFALALMSWAGSTQSV